MIPSDTSLDAERVQRQLLRQKSASERAGMTFRLSSQLIRAGKRAIARTDSRLANWQIGDRFVELHYGQNVCREKLNPPSENMESTSEILQALRPVVDELDRLGVRYYIGGSVASSIHGAVRSTIDVDISGELDEDTAIAFASALKGDFYLSQIAVLDAVRRRTCFNAIHLATSFKVDVFVSQGRDFDRSVQARAVRLALADDDQLTARVATVEDTILLKLEWYRLGDEMSERQWNDVTMLAKLQGKRLDQVYLQRWSGELGVAHLLNRLLSGIDSSDA